MSRFASILVLAILVVVGINAVPAHAALLMVDARVVDRFRADSNRDVVVISECVNLTELAALRTAAAKRGTKEYGEYMAWFRARVFVDPSRACPPDTLAIRYGRYISAGTKTEELTLTGVWKPAMDWVGEGGYTLAEGSGRMGRVETGNEYNLAEAQYYAGRWLERWGAIVTAWGTVRNISTVTRIGAGMWLAGVIFETTSGYQYDGRDTPYEQVQDPRDRR